ncbi:hypothetical protein D9M73_139670 [compost metagenome]
MQGAAVVHGRVQGDDEGAICSDGASREDVAGRVTYLHGGADFASTAELAAGKADHQIGRCFRRGGIAAIDVRCGDRAGNGSVASGIGRRGLQHFAVNLWRIEVEAEHAGRADHGSAQFGAVGSQDTHGATRFGTAGDHAAVRAHGQFGRCGRGGDVGRGDLCGQRGNAAVINGHHVQQFAVGLGRVEGNGEAAVGARHHTANQRAVGIIHFHTAAGRRGTGEGGAISIDGQIARAVGRGGQWYVVLGSHRSITAWVGLHQAQLLAWLCGRIQVDQEGAVGTDHTCADHSAIGIAHFDCGTWFAATAQGQAVSTNCNIGYCVRRCDVRRIELQWRRGVAGGIHQTHIERFTIGLGRRQGEAEQAVGTDDAGAN